MESPQGNTQENQPNKNSNPVLWWGIATTIFGCIGFVICLQLPSTYESSVLPAFIGLTTLLIMGIGIILFIIGIINSFKRQKSMQEIDSRIFISNIAPEPNSETISRPTEEPQAVGETNAPEPNSETISRPTEEPQAVVEIVSPIARQNNLSQAVTSQPRNLELNILQRRTILQHEIDKYITKGYRVISQTDTTAQLVKPKHFSCFWFLFFVIFIIGWLIYLLWYLVQSEKQVYIEVDEYGYIHRR